MRPIIPRTITGSGTVTNITDDNGATWDVEEISSGTFDARSTLYTPMAQVYGSSLTDAKTKIASYAKTHSVYFNYYTNFYVDKNNALWIRKDQWAPYTGKYPPELPPVGTSHWMAETNYYKPYTIVYGENEFELRDTIEGFAKTYKGDPPAKDSSSLPTVPPTPGVTELPPVIIKAEPVVPGPMPPAPGPVVVQAGIGGGGFGSTALGAIAAISGILWWRSR